MKTESSENLCVHTEHCCVLHGCKYGDGENCPVESRRKRQSFPCEDCGSGSHMGSLIEEAFKGEDDLIYVKQRILDDLSDQETDDAIKVLRECLQYYGPK